MADPPGDVALDFPDLRIVLAHGGRPFHMGEAFFILRRHKNVWFDLSGIPPALETNPAQFLR